MKITDKKVIWICLTCLDTIFQQFVRFKCLFKDLFAEVLFGRKRDFKDRNEAESPQICPCYIDFENQ